MALTHQATDGCTISVIIPVLHETERINSIIEHLKNLDDSQACRIIVVDGDLSGQTINAITHDNVIKIVSEKGRAKQMNAGAELATGDILLFLHADTRLPTGALTKITEVLENEKYVAGAFDLAIDSDNRLIKAIAAQARFRSRLTRTPYGDQAIFIRKKYFDEIGRFKSIALMEDVELMRRIKKRGDRISILPDRVKTSARRWEKEGILYTTLRNRALMILYSLGVSPNWLARFYKS